MEYPYLSSKRIVVVAYGRIALVVDSVTDRVRLAHAVAFFGSDSLQDPIASIHYCVPAFWACPILLGFRRFRMCGLLNTSRAIAWQQGALPSLALSR
jgi:hypothetical protein